jgi:hypothetical protein
MLFYFFTKRTLTIMKLAKFICIVVALASSSSVLCLEKNQFSTRRLNTQNPSIKASRQQISVNLLPNFVSISSGGSKAVSVVAQSNSGTFIDKIWNDDTKLATYLAVWYLGNIYCMV